MCHGDVKPRNLLRVDGRWTLCDMDASAALGAPIGERTSSAYSPPELARARFASATTRLPVAARSFDVWMFGVVLFELCQGETLFAQDVNGPSRSARRCRCRCPPSP